MRRSGLLDHVIPVAAYPIVRAGDADRCHGPAIHVVYRCADADQARFDLSLVNGNPVQTCLCRLAAQLCRVYDGIRGEGFGILLHPAAEFVHIAFALLCQEDLSAAGRIGRYTASHLCVADDGAVGLYLVQIKDLMFQQETEVDGLLYCAA